MRQANLGGWFGRLAIGFVVASPACGDNMLAPMPPPPEITPLTVKSVTPMDSATGVALDSEVVITFSRPLEAATVDAKSIHLDLGGYQVPARISLENNNTTVRLSPTAGLGNNGAYRLTLTDGITDGAGTSLAAPFTSEFSTLTASVSATDPSGDTYGTMGLQIDATSFTASAADGALVISFEFASPIGPSLANAANSLAGYIDIDIDQNAATGFAPLTDRFRIDGGSTGMAVEYVVDLFQNDDGSMSIYSQSDVAGQVLPTFTSTTVSLTIPLAMLGGDDGNVNLAAVIGTLVEPTDIVPNAGHVTLGTSGMPAARTAGSPRPARVPVHWR